MTAFGGREDDNASERELKQWGDLTGGEFTSHIYDGGHFYFLDIPSIKIELLADIDHYCLHGLKSVTDAGYKKLELMNSRDMPYRATLVCMSCFVNRPVKRLKI